MFVVTVNFVVAPDHRPDFSAAMLVQADNSLTLEVDCLVFDVCVASDNDCSFFLYEKYTSAAAFDEHLASDHFKVFDALVAPWTVSKSVSTWSEAGDNS